MPNEVSEVTRMSAAQIPHKLTFTLSKHAVETPRQSGEEKRKHTNHTRGISNGESWCFTLGRVE